MYCDVMMEKQNVVAYQEMILKLHEHSQAHSADATMCKRNKKWVLTSFTCSMHYGFISLLEYTNIHLDVIFIVVQLNGIPSVV